MKGNPIGYPKAPTKTTTKTTSSSRLQANQIPPTTLKQNVSANQKSSQGFGRQEPPLYKNVPESKTYGDFIHQPPSYARQPQPPPPQQPTIKSSYTKPQSANKDRVSQQIFGKNEPPVVSTDIQKAVSNRYNGPSIKPPTQPINSMSSQEVKKPLRPMSSKAPVKGGISSREPMAVHQNLEQCRECGRKFNEKALAKHEKICKKVFSQQRKVFNSAKQRIVSKEQVQIVKRVQQQQKHEPSPKKGMMPKWKQESLAFRMAMKQVRGTPPTMNQMKMMQQASQSDTNLKACKWCGRKFNHQAAEKHIPFCEKKAKEAMIRKPAFGGKR